jgi:hypothetical protein
LEEIAARDAHARASTRQVFPGLQARYDRDASDYLSEAAGLRKRGDAPALHRLATTFMQHAAEQFEEACDNLCGAETSPAQFEASAMRSPVPS